MIIVDEETKKAWEELKKKKGIEDKSKDKRDIQTLEKKKGEEEKISEEEIKESERSKKGKKVKEEKVSGEKEWEEEERIREEKDEEEVEREKGKTVESEEKEREKEKLGQRHFQHFQRIEVEEDIERVSGIDNFDFIFLHKPRKKESLEKITKGDEIKAEKDEQKKEKKFYSDRLAYGYKDYEKYEKYEVIKQEIKPITFGKIEGEKFLLQAKTVEDGWVENSGKIEDRLERTIKRIEETRNIKIINLKDTKYQKYKSIENEKKYE